MCINTLDESVEKYNNRCHRKIKMKSIYVKTRSYVDSDVENNDEDHRIKDRYHARAPKYKNIFTKYHISFVKRGFCY